MLEALFILEVRTILNTVQTECSTVVWLRGTHHSCGSKATFREVITQEGSSEQCVHPLLSIEGGVEGGLKEKAGYRGL